MPLNQLNQQIFYSFFYVLVKIIVIIISPRKLENRMCAKKNDERNCCYEKIKLLEKIENNWASRHFEDAECVVISSKCFKI